MLQPASSVPPGWKENPTSFSRCGLLAGLALGGRDRWRSLPWVCLTLRAVPSMGAVVSIALTVVQPTLAVCLASAGLSLALCALGIGDAPAAWQHVRGAGAHGIALGDAVWGRDASASAAEAPGAAA